MDNDKVVSVLKEMAFQVSPFTWQDLFSASIYIPSQFSFKEGHSKYQYMFNQTLSPGAIEEVGKTVSVAVDHTIFTKKTALNPNTNKIICIFATAKSKVDIFTIEKDIAISISPQAGIDAEYNPILLFSLEMPAVHVPNVIGFETVKIYAINGEIAEQYIIHDSQWYQLK